MLVGDYLYISDPQALRRMHGWVEVSEEKWGQKRLQARLVELEKLRGKPNPVLFSPSHDDLPAVNLARWILEDGLPVRLQLQIHKYIWGADARGV